MALKKGYTTGTCAAIALRGAVTMIFEQRTVDFEQVTTPCGKVVRAPILEAKFNRHSASCAVKKYSGDDPDITNGALIFTSVKLKRNGQLIIDGGKGVGRVTKHGLQQKIGEAAINRVPRLMLEQNAAELFDKYGYDGGAEIIVSVPNGEELAKKTFNPRLGIEGGISILGTSGIVEPMSEQAIIDTIKAELSVKKANEGDCVILTPGNYGIDFARDSLGIDLDKAVKCSNFIGDAIDLCAELGFKSVLLIGHIGKLVKLSGGIMNTHSKNADCRAELMASATITASDNISLARQVLECITTDEALSLLNRAGVMYKAVDIITQKALYHLNRRAGDKFETGLIIFSNQYGLLGKGGAVDKIIAVAKEDSFK